MNNILVCIDFDEKTELLIEQAEKFAKSFNSKVWLMHIAAPDPEFVGYGVGPQYIRDFRAEELKKEHKTLQQLAENLQNNNIESEGLLVQGPTVEVIIEESKKLNIDLIIAGHHEHGFFYNAFTGSVSNQIIKESKIPVLIVPIL